jgi:hypothetical protein
MCFCALEFLGLSHLLDFFLYRLFPRGSIFTRLVWEGHIVHFESRIVVTLRRGLKDENLHTCKSFFIGLRA